MSPPLLSRGPGGLRRLTDDQLMVRCGRGDTPALEELLRRHQDAAYRYCWRIFRDHHTAEDMTQDFFLKLFRSAGRYQPRGHFTTWFYRVLANLCFDALRKKKRRRKVNSVHMDPLACEGTELEPLADAVDPTAPLRQEEAKDAVHGALEELPIQVRKALELREFEGLRYREIAVVMDLSLNEVKVLLHRGRKLLARRLARTPVGRDWKGFGGSGLGGGR
ncbi:MAG: RNA polymerase sigma factor [Planctomycetota bacterium]|jgi:RNA polymerase sigma-70 factor (ECF subfamily)